MGYRVKKSGSGFKVSYEIQGKNRHARGVPKEEWQSIGFSPAMTFEEAKARASQLNKLDKLKQIEARRNRIHDRLHAERLSQEVFFPVAEREQFEKTKLKLDKPKTLVYWRFACRLMAEIGLQPKDWFDSKELFYKAIIARQMSGTYVRAVLPMINEWGMFIARKHGTAFLPIPYPRGGWLKDIKEAYRKKKVRRGNRKSAPLTPELLESKRSKLTEAEYRWLKRTVWLGLRAVEADLLNKPSGPDTWWLDTHEDGVTPVIWVYQTKLYGQDDDNRLKAIPCFLPEQKNVLEEIGLPAKRPIQKKRRDVFGEAITLHGGRKNFSALMKKYNQDFQNVSVWLGHCDVTRTYADYFDKKAVTFKKVS
jgi:hypothetical protein